MNSRRGLSITNILIIINVIVFILTIILTNIYGQGFIDLLAVKPSLILQGKNLWTLITNMFVHASFVHILVNMISLYFVGTFLERLIGKKKFILIYFVSGIVASLFFVFLASQSQLNIPAVGASGAIFGIAGVLMLLTPRVPTYLFFIPVAIPLFISVIISLVVMWLASVAAGLPIGNTAHLGGLIAGLIYGYFLRKKHSKKVAMLDQMFRKMY